jgi:hypothetical protein
MHRGAGDPETPMRFWHETEGSGALAVPRLKLFQFYELARARLDKYQGETAKWLRE